MKTELIIICPHCKNRVLPKLDGTCPSCRKNVNKRPSGGTQNKISKVAVKPEKTENPRKGDRSSIVKEHTKPRPETDVRSIKQAVSSQIIKVVQPKRHTQQSAQPVESASIFCQSCGREAQTKAVHFQQNIGIVIMRFTKSVDGNFCRECSSKYFWSFTTTTLFLGWWGVISLIVTPFILLGNLFTYFGTLRLEPPSLTSPYPTLSEYAIEQISPYALELVERINAGESGESVARSVALRAKVTPGQVIVFTFALVQAIQNRKA